MEIEIKKASGRALCRGTNCKRSPEYVKPNGNIVRGTSCAYIVIQTAGLVYSAYYCRDCIDDLYQKMKEKLDTNLWIFH
jgi:hypothetical protein